MAENQSSALRQQVRQQSGKKAELSAAIVDSQSVKTTEKKGRYTAIIAAN